MALMVVLCVLAALDLWRQIAIKSQEQLIQQYKDALKHSYDFWRIGYRLEEVDEQVEVEASRLVSLSASVDSIVRERNKDKSLRSHGKSESVEHIRRSLVLAHSMIRNSSSVFHIRCEEQGNLFRIGSTDYRTDPRDVCQLFVSADPLTDGPQTMFDLIPLDSGAVALRSVANNMFVKAVPPPPDNTEAPWKLVIGGSIPGAAGAFRITSEGYLYSALVGT